MHDIDRTQLEINPEMETFEQEQFEFQGEQEVFGEAELMELASELLEVGNEQELDRFLGNLIKRAGSAIGRIVRSPIGQAIGGVLKGVAKKALPLGGFIGGPLGANIGSGLATMGGSALGLEAETLSQEDREFEGAKQFVRLAGAAVKNAAAVPPGADLRAASQAAVTQAARALAPGLLQGTPAAASMARGGASVHGRSGRWIRRGNKIVLFGA